MPSSQHKEGEVLTGRAKRQAEIEAMMASLDQPATYQKVQEVETTPEDPKMANAQKESDPAAVSKAQQRKLPVSSVFRISSEGDKRHGVTAIAVDPSGARFIVATSDTHLRFYDFAGMRNSSISDQSFRSMIPEDGYWPVSCSFSPSTAGDRLIVGTGSVQPMIIDRDGHDVLLQFVRGDMYVTDQAKTMGHTAAVTAVDWHPLERDRVLTASRDGSARLWDLNGRTQFKKLCCDKVFTVKNARGLRTSVTAACYRPGGREFAVGTSCGSIQVWKCDRNTRPERTVIAAHGEGKPITALAFNIDGSKLASRSNEDDAVKVWNPQRLSKSSMPLVICLNAASVHEHANMTFSADSTTLCASVAESRQVGRLNLYDVSGKCESVEPLFSIDTDASTSPTVVTWHPKLNQIFVGCSNGSTMILYDTKLSTKGALLPASKVGRTEDALTTLLKSRAPTGSAGVTGEIVTPFSLPLFQEDNTSERKRKREDRKDPIKSREPERPATGKHKAGGKNSVGSSFAMFVADQRVAKIKPIAGVDPREALFQYNEGKSYVGKAYEGNESELAKTTAEQDEEEKS